MLADLSPRSVRLEKYKFKRRIALRKSLEVPVEPPTARTLRLQRYRTDRAIALRQGDEVDTTKAVFVEVETYSHGVLVDTRCHYDLTGDYTNVPTPPASPLDPGL